MARQLPWLWLPLREGIEVYKSTLGGIVPLNPFSDSLDFEIWHYTQ